MMPTRDLAQSIHVGDWHPDALFPNYKNRLHIRSTERERLLIRKYKMYNQHNILNLSSLDPGRVSTPRTSNTIYPRCFTTLHQAQHKSP